MSIMLQCTLFLLNKSVNSSCLFFSIIHHYIIKKHCFFKKKQRNVCAEEFIKRERFSPAASCSFLLHRVKKREVSTLLKGPSAKCWSSWCRLLLQMRFDPDTACLCRDTRHHKSAVSPCGQQGGTVRRRGHWGYLQFTSRLSSYVVVLSQQQKNEHGDVSKTLNFPELGASVHSAIKACRSVMWIGSWVWCLMVS